MSKVLPILVLLLGLTVYVYLTHIRPSRELDRTVRGSGTIEATEVIVSPKIAARIVSVAPNEGDEVAAGAVVVTLDCSDLEARKAQAEAQVAQARAGLVQAEAAHAQATALAAAPVVQRDLATREYQRMQRLFHTSAVAERNLDQAEAALKTSREQLKAAQLTVGVTSRAIAVAASQVTLAERALAVAETAISECTLSAPQRGVVLSRAHEPGEMALPGGAILKIGRLDEVHTWIYVGNDEVGRVKLGQQVKLVADTYPGRTFLGSVDHVNDRAEFTPRSIQTKQDRTRLVYGVKVSVKNPDRALLPGMPVEAELVEASPAPPARDPGR